MLPAVAKTSKVPSPISSTETSNVQKVYCQITGITQTKIQQVYQSTQIYPCERPEGQPTALRPYVIDAPLNLIGRDLLMQWQAQIYIPHFS